MENLNQHRTYFEEFSTTDDIINMYSQNSTFYFYIKEKNIYSF